MVRRGGSEDLPSEVVTRGGGPAGYLLTVAQENGTKDFYWLEQIDRKDEDAPWYRYTGMRYWIQPEQEGSIEAFDALIPAFALDAVTSNRNEQDLTLGRDYHCNAVTMERRNIPTHRRCLRRSMRRPVGTDVTEDGDTLTVREQPDAHTLQFVFHTINGEPYMTIQLAE